MEIKAIRSAEDYQAALKELEALLAPKLDSAERDRLRVLATLVEAYEARHFPQQVAGLIGAITFGADQKCL